MSYDNARNEEKDDAFTQTVRGGDRRALSHCYDLASERPTAGRSEDRNTCRACLGYTARDAAPGDEARTEAQQAQAQEYEGSEIDPLTLPYVMMSELRYLPECSGLYFAIEEQDQVAYIGQSLNIRQRWRRHNVERDLCDLTDLQSARRVRVAWLLVSDHQDLTPLERALIRLFKPRLNSNHVPKPQPPPKPKRAAAALSPQPVMAKKEPKMLTVREVAERTGAAENSIRVWLNDETEKQKRFPHAARVSSPRGEYWLIPESDLKGYKNPGRGRPPKPKEDKKTAVKKKDGNK